MKNSCDKVPNTVVSTTSQLQYACVLVHFKKK